MSAAMFESYSKAGYLIGSALGGVVAQRANQIQASLVMRDVEKNLNAIDQQIAAEEADLADKQERLMAGDEEVDPGDLFKSLMLSRAHKFRGYDTAATLIATTISKHPENPMLADQLGVRMQSYLGQKQEMAEANGRLEEYLGNQAEFQQKRQLEADANKNAVDRYTAEGKLRLKADEADNARDDQRALAAAERDDLRAGRMEDQAGAREDREIARGTAAQAHADAQDAAAEAKAEGRFQKAQELEQGKMDLETIESMHEEAANRFDASDHLNEDGSPYTREQRKDEQKFFRKQVEEEYGRLLKRTPTEGKETPTPGTDGRGAGVDAPESADHEDELIKAKEKELSEQMDRLKTANGHEKAFGPKYNPEVPGQQTSTKYNKKVYDVAVRTAEDARMKIKKLEHELYTARNERDKSQAMSDMGQ